MARKNRRPIDQSGTATIDAPKAESVEAETRIEAEAGVEADVENASTPDLVIEDHDEEKIERKRAANKRYREKRKREAANQGETSLVSIQQAALLVTILSSTAVVLVGDEAAINESERSLIVDPLSRMIDRLPAATKQAVEKYSDPIALVFGLSVWGMRVYRVSATRPAGPGPDQIGAPYPIGYEESVPAPEPEETQATTEGSPVVASMSASVYQDLLRMVEQ